jgi:surface antigen
MARRLALCLAVTLGLWAAQASEARADAPSQAVSWAQQYLGQDYDNGLCLQFVSAAYASAGVEIGSASTAAAYWQQNPEHYVEHPGDTSPTVGALVFWGATTTNSAGHVGIFVGSVPGVGSNEVISTSSWPEPTSDPDVHYFSLSGRNAAGYPYDGWLAPAGSGSSTRFADGSFVQVSGSNAIYEIAGGAPLYVSSWANVGGSQPYSVISQAQFNALNSVPANGTFLRYEGSGQIWEIAGGAPLYVSNCQNLNGCPGAVNADIWDIANAGNPQSHLNATPSDGTFLRDPATGNIWVVAGGAPLYVSSCQNLNGCPGEVNIDPAAVSNLDHLNPVPANGTFLRDPATGNIWVVAGGAPLYVSSCQNLNGCPGEVNIDPAAVSNLDHLNASPTNGTIVEGVPSDSYWIFQGGLRSPASAASNATQVDDFGLDGFPTPTTPTSPAGGTTTSGTPTPTSAAGGTTTSGTPSSPTAPTATTHVTGSANPAPQRCVVPRLNHLTLHAAKRRLTSHGCRLGHVHTRHTTHLGAARVLQQTTPFGRIRRAGYRVTLTLD